MFPVVAAPLLLALGAAARSPAVLLISFDGFRYDYFDKGVTPHMEELKQQASHVPYMRNVFPTKTYPNHHSIATGTYPETHGVLASKLFDPSSGKILEPEQLFHYSEQVDPIWSVTERAGRHSGVMMWPANDVQFHGRLPTFQLGYNYSMPWEERVDTMLGWLSHPDTPASLVLSYFEDPDRRAHVFGPESDEVLEQLRRVDDITRYLRARLQQTGLSDAVDVMLLSDHGMTTVLPQRIINLTSVLDKPGVQHVLNSPLLYVFPEQGAEHGLYQELEDLSRRENFSVFRRADMPERWHFKHSPRTPPLLLLAEDGYAFHDMYGSEKYFRNKWNIPLSRSMIYGVHGYDPLDENMRPFFMAWGPHFRNNFTSSAIDSVDVFPLVGHLLGIATPPHNGSLLHVLPMLAGADSASSAPASLWLLSAALAIGSAAL